MSNLDEEKGSVDPELNHFETMPELVRWLFLQSKHDKFVHAAKAAQLKTSTIQGWMREDKTPNVFHFGRWLKACGKSWNWYGKISKGPDFDQPSRLTPPSTLSDAEESKAEEAGAVI